MSILNTRTAKLSDVKPKEIGSVTLKKLDPKINSPVAKTIKCKNCGHIHTFIKKSRGRDKVHCSAKCAADFRDKQPKTKAARLANNKKYYTKYPERKVIVAIKASAKNKGIDFDVSEEWVKSRLQRGICEVTGLPIRTKAGSKSGVRDFYSPSVDRIDNNLGYIESNIRLVAWGLNLSKNKYSDREVNALALTIILSSIPTPLQQQVVDLMPATIKASLPVGHAFSHLGGM